MRDRRGRAVRRQAMVGAMDTLSAFAIAVSIYLAGVMTPGPNTLIIMRQALTVSRRAALYSLAGVWLTSLSFAAIALFGVTVIVAVLDEVAWAIKLVGGLYLIWIGIRTWRSARLRVPADALAAGVGESAFWPAFRLGFLTGISNLKSIAFFFSIFATAIDPGMAAAVKLALLAAIGILCFGWYGLLAVLLSSPPAQAVYARIKTAVDRTIGVALGMIGLGFVAAARP